MSRSSSSVQPLTVMLRLFTGVQRSVFRAARNPVGLSLRTYAAAAGIKLEKKLQI